MEFSIYTITNTPRLYSRMADHFSCTNFTRMLRLVLILFIGVATLAVSSARPEDRLVNADVAVYGRYPYMVSLRVGTSSSHTCGAALVTPEHVVTAAHCVANNVPEPVDPSARFVVTGHLSNVVGGRVTRLSEVRIHPEYNASNTWENDIAVLKLATPIPYTATEQPIPIASADVGVQDCDISGWGRHHTPSNTLPSQLQSGVMATMTRDTCIEYWASSMIFNSTLCVGGVRGNGVCSGDSGGPLVCNRELAGVVSWANLCANGLPDGFARVFYYRDWLLEETADLSDLGRLYMAEARQAAEKL
ncbi:chymotrypsin-like protease CTRL-1 isoform X2 [Diprion similis]|uniref:chymotrypsin-like protease CTRL-1 isoform X2 n=1 Tax=Diprion similis TaxID=362088 RepID=UPI001EF88146|nr:chymotrypsin-like protease CTRL-1 isoform X2 [Diprion similis]